MATFGQLLENICYFYCDIWSHREKSLRLYDTLVSNSVRLTAKMHKQAWLDLRVNKAPHFPLPNYLEIMQSGLVKGQSHDLQKPIMVLNFSGIAALL